MYIIVCPVYIVRHAEGEFYGKMPGFVGKTASFPLLTKRPTQRLALDKKREDLGGSSRLHNLTVNSNVFS